ncbi:MAG: hydroxymethylglutaryl-CoA lyase [Panacagrimonas sp.]
MNDFPKKVEFHEEGVREGFQMEPVTYPREQRVALLDALSETGLAQIQVGSLVNPRKVPQMADTLELFAEIKKNPKVRYTLLWLNESGYQKAREVRGAFNHAPLMYYLTDAFAMRNNNRTAADMRAEQEVWLDRYLADGATVQKVYVMTAWGCNLGGPVSLQTVTDAFKHAIGLFRARNLPIPPLYLADTMGWANPEEVKRRIGAVRELAPEAKIGLHLHDTRGLGGANVYAALSMGVTLFDASVAGLGGCPFAGHKARQTSGNVCTEDMVFLCHELGIETGIHLEKLIEASRMAEEIIGRPLMGRVMHSGSLKAFREGKAADSVCVSAP